VSDPTRVVKIALRLSLAAAFLSAVADRFGWWGPYGQGNVGWGNMSRVADYTHLLVPFASGWLLTVLAWTTTATEIALGLLLLTGLWPKLVGAACCLVLITYGIAMAVSLGIESPLSFSVFSAASAGAAYAVLGKDLRVVQDSNASSYALGPEEPVEFPWFDACAIGAILVSTLTSALREVMWRRAL
jgi:uncharacterized membrane protein YphA (DoxX/SURF4 family)